MISYKDQGNDEFKKENYLKAAALYTQAIKEDPQNAVLYSNRSAALLKLNKVTKAMEDAEKCIALNPDWEKGYFRKAAILELLDKMPEAIEVYQAASQLNNGEGGANKELAGKIRLLNKVLKSKGISLKEETLESMLIAAAGGSDATQQQRLSEFCRDLAVVALDNVAQSGTAFPPSLHFLPGPQHAETHEEKESHIQAAHAFDSPEVLGDFVMGMRAAAKRLSAVAALAIVPKAAVCFPQLWTRKAWPSACGSKHQAGVFVQLETRASAKRHIWFVPVRADKSTSPPVELNFDDFGLLPQLFE